MESEDVYDDEFQLVNEFENLNNDELIDKDHQGNDDDHVDVGKDFLKDEEDVETLAQKIH